MKLMRFGIIASLVFAVVVFPGSVASAQCVSGTITAELQGSGSFAGLYKYTIVITWDTPQGLSNVTLDCGFGECVQQACEQTFAFDSLAGTSDGEPEPCTAGYSGEFNCNGNPSVGVTDPIVKWAALNGDCEPGRTGTATLCFYTNLPPNAGSEQPVFLVKNGQNVCQGQITGDCPVSPCTVPTRPSTWGAVKAIYNFFR